MTPTFIIDWMGPYKDPNETNRKNILYLIVGSSITGRPSVKLRYIGKTSSDCKGRFNDSHKFWTHIGKDRSFWIGKIKSSNSAKIETSAISMAEKLLVFYLKNYSESSKVQLLNKKLKNEPKKSFGILNRCLKKNALIYKRHHFPFLSIPNIILWERARGILFSSNRIRVEKDSKRE